MCDAPTAQCRRQGGLVKCYFYPEYLNSDDCDGVFDVTRSSRQNGLFSWIGQDQWKIFSISFFPFPPSLKRGNHAINSYSDTIGLFGICLSGSLSHNYVEQSLNAPFKVNIISWLIGAESTLTHWPKQSQRICWSCNDLNFVQGQRLNRLLTSLRPCGCRTQGRLSFIFLN